MMEVVEENLWVWSNVTWVFDVVRIIPSLKLTTITVHFGFSANYDSLVTSSWN